VFALAIVVVGGIVVTQPLGAIAHFSHRPHAGGECQKTIVSVKYQKDQKESLEQRRNTPNSGGSGSTKTRGPEFGVLRLCSFFLLGRFLAFSRIFAFSEGIQGSGNKWLTYYHLLALLAFYSCR
jgi:hypothetical protein